MSKPTKRVTKTIKINYQMTETRAKRFNEMVKIFVKAAKYAPYPNEFIAEYKGDFIEVVD